MSTTEQLEKALKPAIAGAVTNALSRADGPALGGSVPAAIIKETTETAAAVIVNQTNNEPWYQSRVTWGALISVFAGILAMFGYVFPAEAQSQLVTVIVSFAPVVGGVLAWYGRWIAKKPLNIGPNT